ncbi:MAG: TolC family protein [Sulfurovum sp.]|uniref:TolC family protein n=1 Tax=Sulfurovum sp. TaxID=1969726 RepID=UPI0028680D1D|nr:TolC family protein [Sulfurovum sp.]MCO4844984.1 TolC family protein [Sulfurovum sp.]
MRIVLFTLLSVGLLQAQSIHQLIDRSIKKNPSLQTIQYRLSAMDQQIEGSQNFSNPDLSLTINDIQFDHPSDRGLEPMQYNAINFKQQFPWFGKLDARKTFTQAQKSVMLDSYEVAKITLAEEIRMTAYTMKELEERISIVNRYKIVAKQNIDLYTAYASTENKSHTSSMSASLMLSKIKIRAERYNTILKTQKAKLKYLVQGNVSSISDTLQIKRPKSLGSYLSKLQNNPNYHMKLSERSVADANKAIQDLSITPDPYVKVGYFNRTEFPDYVSVTVGISLPLYGSEKLNSEAARKEVLAAQSASLDYRSSLESEIDIMYAKLTEAYHIYNIIQNESLPQLEHMFELSQSSIQNGGDLFAYTNLLEQKLALEEQRVSIKAEYLRTQARLKSLIGKR